MNDSIVEKVASLVAKVCCKLPKQIRKPDYEKCDYEMLSQPLDT